MKKHKFILLGLSFIILFLFGNLYIRNVYATDTGFLSGSIVESIDNGYPYEWINPYKALTQNNIYTNSYLVLSINTDWLRITDFNFDLTDNSIIKGIEVQIDDFGSQSVYAIDCYLVINGNSIGIDKETYTFIGLTDTDTYRTYGSSTDMWNTELSQSDIKSSTFGFQIFYKSESFCFSFVDHIQIKVYYIESENDIKPNIDFIIIFSLLGIFLIMILILLFSILLIKK